MYEITTLKIDECDNPSSLVYYLDDTCTTVRLNTYLWLIRGSGNNILVDTGFIKEQGIGIRPKMMQLAEEEPMLQLAKLGIKGGEITHVIITHAHFDHLSPVIDNFVGATIVIQRSELATVCAPSHPWFGKFVFEETIRKLTREYSRRTRLVEGDEEIVPGISVFWTGGHTSGHQAVVVETAKGKVVIAGDVVFTYRNLEEDIPVGFNSNLEECFLAMRRIRKEADIVIPGHDPLVLERAPFIK